MATTHKKRNKSYIPHKHTNLGLYHVQFLCRSYQGDIQVRTLAPENQYTKCFTITLPL